MAQYNSFQPAFWLKNGYVQTFLASSGIRAMGKNPMADCGREQIVEVGKGVRLLGHYSPRVEAEPKGLIILLPGWEGGSESAYILSAGRYFYNRGTMSFALIQGTMETPTT